jgi:hypothetical protein
LKRALCVLLLCSGCYQLSDLESSATTNTITMIGTPQTSENGDVALPTGIEKGDTLLLTLHNYPESTTVAGWTSEQDLASQCADSIAGWRRTVDGTEISPMHFGTVVGSDVVLVAYRGAASAGNLRTVALGDAYTGPFAVPVAGTAGDLVFVRVLVDESEGATWSASDGFTLRAQSGQVAIFDGVTVPPAPSMITVTPSLGRCPAAISESLTPS